MGSQPIGFNPLGILIGGWLTANLRAKLQSHPDLDRVLGMRGHLDCEMALDEIAFDLQSMACLRRPEDVYAYRVGSYDPFDRELELSDPLPLSDPI